MSINNIVDELDGLASRAVFESGAVYGCRFHEDVWIRSGDTDAEKKAYAYMTNLLKKEWGGLEWREDAMEAVKDKLDSAAEDECPQCAHNRSL